MTDQPLLEARHLRKVYRGGGAFSASTSTVAVDDVSLSISAMQPSFMTLAGESGSGKTTIARLLLGLEQPSAGQVLYRGQPLSKLDRATHRRYRREVQSIFQDPFEVYNPFYRVDHLLETPLKRFGLARTRRDMAERIEVALEAVGLRPAETLGRYPHQLSGGQRQRITIARALLLQPRLIIADEPVSMIDASLRATILQSLHRLYRDHGISFIYITHDLTTAYQVSDTLVILYGGAVAEAGPVDRVVKAPQHPYTQELVGSIPNPWPGTQWLLSDVEGDDEEETAAGAMADQRRGEGCAYAERCIHVQPHCRERRPPLYRSRPSCAVACYLYEAAPALSENGLHALLMGEETE